MLRAALRLSIAFAILAGLAAYPVAAERARQLGVADMVSRAGRVFTGTCVQRIVVEGDAGSRPHTTYTFEVHRPIKGVAAGQQTVTFSMAATPDGRGFRGLPVFHTGQTALLLLYPPGPKGLTSPMGIDQGWIRVAASGAGTAWFGSGRNRAEVFRDVPPERLRSVSIGSGEGPMDLAALEDLLLTLVDERPP